MAWYQRLYETSACSTERLRTMWVTKLWRVSKLPATILPRLLVAMQGDGADQWCPPAMGRCRVTEFVESIHSFQQVQNKALLKVVGS